MVKDLGLVISKHRNMKNLSQEKLADLIGVSRQAIVNWEENKSTPSLINFVKISEELDIPMAVISDSKKQLEKSSRRRLRFKACQEQGKLILL